jgi:DNA-directed RNA polymerase subunit RPC12/RpoP
MARKLIDTERHTVACPHCRRRFGIKVRVYRTKRRVLDDVAETMRTLGPEAIRLLPQVINALKRG